MLRMSGLLVSAFLATLLLMMTAMQPRAQPYPARENDEGYVMVTVTPLALSKSSDAWRFDVRLNNHVAPIMQDMAKVATLGDGKGHDEQPLSWNGDPPGGHHRKGVLVFKPIKPAPHMVTLKIRRVGDVPVRAFTWNMPS